MFIAQKNEKEIPLIRVLIVEDNKYMREGWQTFIDHDKELVVLDSFVNCERLLVSKELKKADVIIMDIGLPGMTGIEGVKAIKALHPSIHVIMATIHDDNEHIFDAIKAGAVGYLLKGVSPSELIHAIKAAHAGGSPITPNIARKILEKMHAPILPKEEQLSDRELQILNELASGKSYSAIGKDIFLSIDGVRHHIRNIYQKLQVNSRSEAVTKGIVKKLINP